MSKKVNVSEEALGVTKEDQEAVLAAQGLNFARKFNRKFKTLQKQETALINLVREVVALDSRSAMKEFKQNVNADRSTVNRYIKIAECRFINDNVEQLPVAVSVLLKIAQQMKNHASLFQEKLDAGELSPDTTLRNIKEWLEASADDGMKESGEPVEMTEFAEVTEDDLSDLMVMKIDFNELFQREDVKGRHLEEIIDATADLCAETALGTAIWEALVEVQSALDGNIQWINDERQHRAERVENIQMANAA